MGIACTFVQSLAGEGDEEATWSIPPPAGPSLSMAPSQQRRLRFDSIRHATTLDGHCRMSVRLEWDGEHYQKEHEGLETHQGRLQAAASAALGATLSAAEDRLRSELLGVKAVRAFDGWVVVVRLNAELAGSAVRLLGAASCESEEDLGKGAALAVLDATNRVLERELENA